MRWHRWVFRWEVSTTDDNVAYVGWLTRREALAYAVGLSDAGQGCAIVGPGNKRWYLPEGNLDA